MENKMAFRQIKAPALATASVVDTKLNTSAITGQIASTGGVSADTLLMHDSVNNVLNKISFTALIGSFDTDDIQEGTNKFFTNALAQAAVAQDITDAVAAEAVIARAAELANAGAITAEETRALAAEGVNATAITAEENRATGRENAIESAYQAADTNLQTQINNILNNTDATALNSLAEIVSAFEDADDTLTAGISANATAIANETIARTNADVALQGDIDTAQAELDATQVGAGLASDGSYVVSAGGNYVGSATSFKDADDKLDAAIKVIADGLAAEISTTGGEVTALQAADVTLQGNIDTVSANLVSEASLARAAEVANANAIQDEINARAVADTAVRTDFATADTSIQNELDATQAGAGLGTDGAYTADATTDYLVTATSLVDADKKLDAALKAVDTAYKAADTTLQSNIDSEAATRLANDNALDARVTVNEGDITSLETDVTALEGVVGDIGTTPLDTISQTLGGAINELHTDTNAVEVRVTDAEADIVTNATAISNILSNTDAAALDSLTEIVAAFQAADNSLTGLISANTNAISAEETRALAAEGVNATNITSEALARGTADTTLQGNITAEAATRLANDNTLQGNIDSEAATRLANDNTLQANVDAVEVGAGLEADGSYSADATTDYLTAATSLKDADKKLDAALKAVDTAYKAADTALAGRATTLETEMDAAEGRLDAAEAAATLEASTRASADTTLQGNIDTLSSEVDSTQAGAGLAADGTYVANASTNYLTAAASLKDATEKLDTQAKVTADALAAEITARESDVDAEEARALAAEGGLQTQITNEQTARSSADATHTANIATNTAGVAANVAAIATETQARQSGDSALQNELDAVELASGLETDGTFGAHSGTNYIDTADSLKATDVLLDTALKATDARVDAILDGSSESLDQFVEVVTAFQTADGNLNQAITDLAAAATTDRTAVRSEFAAADSALNVRLTAEEGNVDALEATMGTATLTTTAQTVTAAINELNSGSAAAVADLQAEVDLTQTALGLNADGTFAAHSGTNHMDAATTAKGARELLDTAIKAEETRALAAEGVNAAAIISGDATVTTNFQAADTSIRTDFAAADSAIQSELDASQVGAGLNTDGGYTANASTNYLTAASSLKDADTKLDAAIKVNADAIANEASARAAADSAEAGIRSAADTTLQGNITAEAGLRIAGDAALQGSITALETEMTATQSGAGLAADGTYAANAAANYIATATSLKDADNKLDAAIKVNTDGLTTETAARIAADSAETTRATGEESRIEGLVTAEVTRSTGVDAAQALLIQANADNLAAELLTRAAGDVTLQGNIDTLSATVTNIISNTDAAALDSLTEIVTAFQDADGTLTGAVAANTTAISDEEARALAAEGVNAAAVVTEAGLRAAGDLTLQGNIDGEAATRLANDNALQADIDTKLALAGGTMSGAIAMGGNKVTGLAAGVASTDAINKGQLDAAISAQDISVYTTDDLDEGTTNKYFSNELARAAVSASGDLSYNSTTGVFSVDTDKAILDLTDYVGTETDYTNMQNYILQVNDAMTGVELVDPASVAFQTVRRQTIDGDGTQTAFAMDFTTSQSDAMVFVGGVIQDPGTHYTLNGSTQTITFPSALPLGTQAVVIANPVASVPFIEAGSVSADKFSSDIKAYTQKSAVSAGTGGSVIDTFSGTSYRSGKYIIQVDDNSGNYETREALVVHDGTSAYITEFAIVYTGAGLLGDASVNMNGNNVELTYTANSAGTTVKVISTYIDV